MEMNWLQALVLGIIEGITEFLPVSSTGHLVVAQRLLGIGQTEAANAYAIVIQSGAILAIIGLYRIRMIQIIRGLFGKDPQGARLMLALVVAFFPAAILGYSFDEAIERYLFGAWPVVGAWIAGGLLILALGARIERRTGLDLEKISLKAALLVGLAQCVALWPGVSRSLATILGGLAVGLALDAAVEFSFLLGLITLGAATGYKAISSGSEMIAAFGATALAVGFVAAFVSAVLAVRWMVRWLQTRGLRIFAWWRIGIGLAVIAMLYLGLI